MSEIRISHPGQPLRLIDLGPQAARLTVNHYAVGANVGDAMVPILKAGGDPLPEKPRDRPGRQQAVQRVAQPRPAPKAIERCDAPMLRAKVPCDRLPGHTGFHRSGGSVARRLETCRLRRRVVA